MRILFIGEPDNIYTARWLEQLEGEDWELYLLPVNSAKHHPRLPKKVKIVYKRTEPLKILISFIAWLLARWPHHRGSGHAHRLRLKLLTYTSQGPAHLSAQAIERLQPDIVHMMSLHPMRNELVELKRKMGERFPACVVSNWGDSQHQMPDDEANRGRIHGLFAAADYMDSALARFKPPQATAARPQLIPRLLGSAGFDLAHWRRWRHPGPPAKRRNIVVWEDFGGREEMPVSMRVLIQCAELLRAGHYRVIFMTTSPYIYEHIKKLTREYKIPAAYLAADRSQVERMRVFGTACIYLHLNNHQNALLKLMEAMVMDAFPILSSTVGAETWLNHKQTGLLVDPDDPAAVAAALRMALIDDQFVNKAVELNAHTVCNYLSHERVKQQSIEFYKSVYVQSRGHAQAADLKKSNHKDKMPR